MKNILVTGGCGFIGSHLTEALLLHGQNVLVIDDKIFVLKASENNPANNNCGKLEIYYSSIKDIFNFWKNWNCNLLIKTIFSSDQ